jgi:YaiO family outer membrane protein
MISWIAGAVCAAALGAPGDSGAARPTDSTTRAAWRGTLTYGFEAFTAGRATWQAWMARVERKTPQGSLALEALHSSRFSLWDDAGALDAYHTLWRRAYGNVRIALAPGAQVLPRLDATAEVFQGVGGGWEASAGYRRMSFSGSGVNLWSASLAKYVGNWYVVARGTAVPQSGKLGGGVGLLVRRYFQSANDFLDVSGGTGSEVVTLGADSVNVSRSQSLSVRLQHFVSARVGLTIAATFDTQQGIPNRRGLVFGGLYRW